MDDIKFSPPDITDEEINEVIDTLRSGWLTTGPKTKLLERELAAYCGTDKFACLNSATAAMELTLRLFGIGEGDEVITSAYTYTATASVICHVGAKPVIVDTDPESFEISAQEIEKALTEKTRAVIAVDIGGVICNYDTIKSMLQGKKFMPKNDMQKAMGRVLILADAAHSFGSIKDGKVSGRHADFSCFSFHAVKNFAMGEGGGVTWLPVFGVSDEDIYRQLMLLSLHGQTKDALSKTKLGSWEYDIAFPGYKCNLTDILASLGLAQIKRYPFILKRRGEIVAIYDEIINKSLVKTLKHEGPSYVSNKHLYIARIQDKDENFRNNLIVKMAERGIPTNVHFKPLPLLTAYKNMGYNISCFPNAYNMYKNAVSLPLHTLLSDQQAIYIARSFNEVLEEIL